MIVLFHGLTNSPRQFESLTERFVGRGYSLFIPRIPYHGYTDRMSVDHAQLSERDLVETTSMAVDLASGLADHITVSGISLGGVLAIWAAHYRHIAVAAPIAPAIGFKFLPMRLTGMTFGTMRRLPNRFVWWDPRVKDKLEGPPYAYPRFSTHAIAQTQKLGLDLLKAARTAPPKADSVWMITNAADLAVNNAASVELVRRWRGAGATNVHQYEFAAELKLFHDLIDPLQPNSAGTGPPHPGAAHRRRYAAWLSQL